MFYSNQYYLVLIMTNNFNVRDLRIKGYYLAFCPFLEKWILKNWCPKVHIGRDQDGQCPSWSDDHSRPRQPQCLIASSFDKQIQPNQFRRLHNYNIFLTCISRLVILFEEFLLSLLTKVTDLSYFKSI